VAANQNLPLAGLDENTQRIVTLEGQSSREQETNPFVHLQSVGPGYFRVMGIPLLAGRALTADDRERTPPAAVVGRRLAGRLWPGESPLGRRLKLGPPDADAAWLTVVGMVGDVQSERVLGPASLDLYVSHHQHFTGDTYFVLRTRLGGADLVRSVEGAIRGVDRDQPIFDLAPMSRRVADAEWERRVSAALALAFGLSALALAAVGLYGVMAQAVVGRTRELGVRQALGARPRDLFRAVLGEGLGLLAVGAATGILAALGLARGVASLLVGIGPTDPWTFLAAPSVLGAVAAVACLVPARRAARLDPVVALRHGG
jgi:predicted permease